MRMHTQSSWMKISNFKTMTLVVYEKEKVLTVTVLSIPSKLHFYNYDFYTYTEIWRKMFYCAYVKCYSIVD